ncbi:MAG: FeoA domain-containing protein [Candidatus Thermoplasmatota archaeon]|nr:FeoA domain-containing protein [Candidatus Thermoplasmatota archaeon]
MTEGLPLLMLSEGKEGRILGINGGHCVTRRLVEMGFTDNALVRVLRSDHGRLIVSVNGCRYALGRGVAMKIYVKNCNGE